MKVIIYARHTLWSMAQCVKENYGNIKYMLPFINALCAEIPPEKLAPIKKNKRVALVSHDAEVSKLVMPTIHTMANATMSEVKISSFLPSPPVFLETKGDGVNVAIIDTGLAPHYDIVKPSNRIVQFKDFLNEKNVPYDDDGHGTHVAGIIGGNGYSSNLFFGAAPKVGIVALKALDSQGNGNTSDILAAMNWVYENRKKYNIKVVNLSLGVTVDEKESEDPLVRGAEMLVRSGISVITAAGNSGPDKRTITSPGTSPLVITVGSFGSHGVSSFSSRGPTLKGIRKPDFVANGENIFSLDSSTCKTYMAQSGTSMSAPLVSGLVACLYSYRPGLTPLQVKSILASYAVHLECGDRNSEGYGAL